MDWRKDRLLWRALFVGYGAVVLWCAFASVGDLITDIAVQRGSVSTVGIYGVRYANADALNGALSAGDTYREDAGAPSIVSFRTADGRLVEASRHGVWFGPWPKNGERVDVAYDPQDPTRAIIAGQPIRDHAVFSVVLVVLAITTVIPSLRRWLTGRS